MTNKKTTQAERKVEFVNAESYWTIPVKNGAWQLSNRLIPSMLQEEAAKYTSPDGFHALSMHNHFDIFSGLYKLRNSPDEDTQRNVESARQFIQETIRNKFPLSLTRIIYSPKGKDNIIHNYNTNNQCTNKVSFVGDDGEISEVLSLKACLALTGRKPEEVSEIMHFINNTPAHIWRANSKPDSFSEYVAWFVADSCWAGLDCLGSPSDAIASLGGKFVVREKKFKR